MNFVNSSNPWFNRGGYYDNGDIAGVFYFYYGFFEPYIYDGFRVVLSVTE